jgi:hypothetical protein
LGERGPIPGTTHLDWVRLVVVLTGVVLAAAGLLLRCCLDVVRAGPCGDGYRGGPPAAHRRTRLEPRPPPGERDSWPPGGCRFWPGQLEVMAAECYRTDAVPVAAAVYARRDQAAAAQDLVGVVCGALPPASVDDPVVTGERVASAGDAGHHRHRPGNVWALRADAVTPAVALGSSFAVAIVLIMLLVKRCSSGGFCGE